MRPQMLCCACNRFPRAASHWRADHLADWLSGPACVRVRACVRAAAGQMTGVYKVKKPHLVPLHRDAQTLSKAFARFAIHHVPREQNGVADRMSNVAIDTYAQRTRACRTHSARAPASLPVCH